MSEGPGITAVDHLARMVSKEPWSRLVESALGGVWELVNDLKARLYGSLAVYHYLRNCKECLKLIDMYRKGVVPDVNLVVHPSSSSEFRKRAKSLGFKPVGFFEELMGDVASVMGRGDYPFFIRAYFTEVLRLNHDVRVDFEQGGGVLKPLDLFLTKLQIHKPHTRHLVDLGLLASQLDLDPRDVVNAIGNDWGFVVDAHNNLREAIDLFRKLMAQGSVTKEFGISITKRLTEINNALQSMPNFLRYLSKARSVEKYWNDYVGSP